MEPLLTRVEAVLFDLDGTLVDTNIDFPLMRREMAAIAVEHGIEPEAIDEMDILAIVEATVGFVASRDGERDATALHARAMSVLQEIELRHARETQEIPFAQRVVDNLRGRGIRIGIVTRNCRAASVMSLSIAGIEPDVMICREDTNRHKPHPEPLLVALERLGAQPKTSIMVGDHLMDIESGKRAGMKTVGFLREDRPRDFFDEVAPDLVADNLKEVLDAIIGRDR